MHYTSPSISSLFTPTNSSSNSQKLYVVFANTTHNQLPPAPTTVYFKQHCTNPPSTLPPKINLITVTPFNLLQYRAHNNASIVTYTHYTRDTHMDSAISSNQIPTPSTPLHLYHITHPHTSIYPTLYPYHPLKPSSTTPLQHTSNQLPTVASTSPISTPMTMFPSSLTAQLTHSNMHVDMPPSLYPPPPCSTNHSTFPTKLVASSPMVHHSVEATTVLNYLQSSVQSSPSPLTLPVPSTPTAPVPSAPLPTTYHTHRTLTSN